MSRYGSIDSTKNISAVNLTGIKSIEKSKLVQFVGTLDDEVMERVCVALSIATGCNE